MDSMFQIETCRVRKNCVSISEFSVIVVEFSLVFLHKSSNYPCSDCTICTAHCHHVTNSSNFQTTEGTQWTASVGSFIFCNKS